MEYFENWWIVIYIALILIYLLFTVSQYIVSKRQGIETSWFAFIPLLQYINMLQIAWMSWLRVIVAFIPFVNIILYIVICANISSNLWKWIWTTIGLILLPVVFFPLLAFNE